MTGLALIPLLLWSGCLIDRWAAERKIEWKRGAGVRRASRCWSARRGISSRSSTPATRSIRSSTRYSVGGIGPPNLRALRDVSSHCSAWGTASASFLMLPFNLTFHSEAFYDRPGLFVGPIFLVALPMLFLAQVSARGS